MKKNKLCKIKMFWNGKHNWNILKNKYFKSLYKILFLFINYNDKIARNKKR